MFSGFSALFALLLYTKLFGPEVVQVQTFYGTFDGHHAMFEGLHVYTYLGIPFGRTGPVRLRFQRANPYKGPESGFRKVLHHPKTRCTARDYLYES